VHCVSPQRRGMAWEGVHCVSRGLVRTGRVHVEPR
jgi:hypothetical protein